MGKETEERKESSEGRVVEVAILERDLQNTHLLLTGKGKKLGSKENIPMHRVFECGKQLPKTKNKEDKQKWDYFQVASINLFWAFPRCFYKIRPIPERCKRNYFFSPHLQELDKKKKKKNEDTSQEAKKVLRKTSAYVSILGSHSVSRTNFFFFFFFFLF
jgi:hypothetical protein